MDRMKNETNNKYIILGLFMSLTLLFFFFGSDVSDNNIKEKNEVNQINNNENEVNKEKTNENEKKSINNNNNSKDNNLNDMPENVNVESLKKNINQTKLEYEKYIEEQRQLFIQQSSRIHTFFLILFSSILLIIYLWSGYKIQQRNKKLKNKNLNANQKDNEYKLLINEDEFEEYFYE